MPSICFSLFDEFMFILQKVFVNRCYQKQRSLPRLFFFTSDASAISAVKGIYSLMSGNTGFANGYLEFYTGLSSDEFYNYNPAIVQAEFFR